MQNDADVAARARRPEVFVFGLLNPVQAHAGVRRVQLEVEGCGFDGLLLVAGKAGQTVGECVSYTEVQATPKLKR